MPLPHTPNSCAELSFTHTKGPSTGCGLPDQPQQSLSARQVFPSSLQPLSGWHTLLPLGPKGAHEREQQLPPHAVGEAPGEQSTPLWVQPPAPAPVAGVALHWPSVAPAAFVQLPLQHSTLVVQTSSGWTQNDGFVQIPLLQYFDAQSLSVAHGLPDVAGPPPLSGAHLPPPAPSGTQLPPQHSSLLPHA